MADLITGFGLVGSISRLIPALLVLVIIFGLLGFTHMLGDNKFVHALIAFCVAVLFLLSDQATKVVSFMAPWFTVLFIFIIFVLIAFKTMGVSDDQIIKTMANYKSIVWWIVALAIIIAIISLGNVFGQKMLSDQPGYEDYTLNQDGTYTSPEGVVIASIPGGVASTNYQTNITRTIFHPKILGLILVGLIATFSVYFMTKSK